MSSRYNIVLLWVVCLCCEVVMIGCEVVCVNRNVTDSFRVGEDGCTNNTNVCANVSATCQPDGSCLCNSTNSTYHNPVIEFKNSDFVNGDSYICINNTLIHYGVGECCLAFSCSVGIRYIRCGKCHFFSSFIYWRAPHIYDQ